MLVLRRSALLLALALPAVSAAFAQDSSSQPAPTSAPAAEPAPSAQTSAQTSVQARIRARREGQDWVLSVRDNGLGIDEKYFRRIFQPFGRLHGSDLPGSGLGLAICERIVRKAGGRLWVESTPGAGSTFCFTARAATSHAAGGD